MQSAVLFTFLDSAIATVPTQIAHVIESDKMNCPNYCLDVYDPVGDDEGDIYSNECYMKQAKCEKNKETAPPLSKDDFDFITDDSEKPRRKCPQCCPAVELLVCGSDGVIYGNPCKLQIAACEHPELNIVGTAGPVCAMPNSIVFEE
ncbi:hypothetical protein F444_09563 [Phytophthora nicotianae P1976]|uniref:Kazal-like domain-containing protein n=1 Tax=Phytophthora nicotianae P1976 TaxID=1317066 RepID=A0A081A7A1_PHYNI|nr:hypothetical protein F444_09563 [Phytophthora nicotianae P1976]